ncbi:twin-arginine translocase TatA/TatE family subunit [Paenibacillus sp. NFR01]|uniref:twin-arginine translocase TatA/TatE family subunit n=1 Tax=Paenibacillus sp. NFR01 TaxID=1566279 RepID=UPI0008CEAD03|nr:twin-arginine translocase TatA/TatE family subunit [Paenibacillus sp. NFR01]SET98311.1 sec-independent protein translocase protein TatA [Paenibacillus sp. NFR01]
MLNSIGAPGIILLVILALLLFGPNKLPELGRAVGRTFREFKDGAREIISEPQPASKSETPAAAVAPQTVAAELPQDKRLPE